MAPRRRSGAPGLHRPHSCAQGARAARAQRVWTLLARPPRLRPGPSLRVPLLAPAVRKWPRTVLLSIMCRQLSVSPSSASVRISAPRAPCPARRRKRMVAGFRPPRRSCLSRQGQPTGRTRSIASGRRLLSRAGRALRPRSGGGGMPMIARSLLDRSLRAKAALEGPPRTGDQPGREDILSAGPDVPRHRPGAPPFAGAR